MKKTTNSQKIIKNAKTLYTKCKRTLKKHPEAKGAVKALGVLLSALAVYNAGAEIINPEYQIAEVQNQTAVTEEGEYGFIDARTENEPERTLGGNVRFGKENGDIVKVPYANISVLSNAFSKREIEKYPIVYKLTQDAELKKQNKRESVVTYLKAGTVVIGQKIEDGEYVEVRTDNGLTGKVLVNSLEKIFEAPEKEEEKKSNTTHRGDGYRAVNGEVIGIDVNTSAVNLDDFEKMLTGDIKYDRVGQIKDTKPNYVYIKIGGYYAEYSEHTALWNENEYEKYMSRIVEMIRLCQKHNVEYGFYFYSTAITEQEALAEADLINRKMEFFKGHGIEPPALPLAIDIETKKPGAYDRQKALIGHPDEIEKSSKARAKTFDEVLKKNGDYISLAIYTNQNVTGARGNNNEKIIDMETLADNIKDMDTLPIWWVAQLTVESADNSGKAVQGSKTPKGKELHIYGKQITQDTVVPNCEFLVDYSIIYEDDYLEILDNAKGKKKTATIGDMSLDNSTPDTEMIAYIPKHRTKLYGIGKGKDKGYVDESTQLLGRSMPDSEGKIIVVTRDGRKGRIDLSNLEKLDRSENAIEIDSDDREEI